MIITDPQFREVLGHDLYESYAFMSVAILLTDDDMSHVFYFTKAFLETEAPHITVTSIIENGDGSWSYEVDENTGRFLSRHRN